MHTGPVAASVATALSLMLTLPVPNSPENERARLVVTTALTALAGVAFAVNDPLLNMPVVIVRPLLSPVSVAALLPLVVALWPLASARTPAMAAASAAFWPWRFSRYQPPASVARPTMPARTVAPIANTTAVAPRWSPFRRRRDDAEADWCISPAIISEPL